MYRLPVLQFHGHQGQVRSAGGGKQAGRGSHRQHRGLLRFLLPGHPAWACKCPIGRIVFVNGDSLTQYCSEKARNASAWFESSKAIMAESFATGSDHQVVNELNGERLREPNEVFKRLGRAIRYNFQVDDAKFRRDNVKEIISTLFANKVDVDHPENKYKDFKDLEDNVEKRLQNRQAKYQNEINQL